MSEASLPFTFHDFPASAFPITFRAFRVSDDEQVWEDKMPEPGALLVPPLAKEEGEVWIEVEYGDGVVVRSS